MKLKQFVQELEAILKSSPQTATAEVRMSDWLPVAKPIQGADAIIITDEE